jgi:acylphosphatase
VRNEPDGSVAALIAGPEDAVRAMVAALHGGPPRARVDAVEVEPAKAPRRRVSTW